MGMRMIAAGVAGAEGGSFVGGGGGGWVGRQKLVDHLQARGEVERKKLPLVEEFIGWRELGRVVISSHVEFELRRPGRIAGEVHVNEVFFRHGRAPLRKTVLL